MPPAFIRYFDFKEAKKLEKLVELTGSFKVSEVLNLIEIELNELSTYLNFLVNSGMDIFLNNEPIKNDLNIIECDSTLEIKAKKIPLNLKGELNISLKEWIALNITLSRSHEFEASKNETVEGLLNKLSLVLNSPRITLDDLDNFESNITNLKSYDLKNEFEKSIENNSCLSVASKQQNENIDILVRKLVFLDGELNIVFEYLKDNSLNHMPLSSIENLIEIKRKKESFYSRLELDDYISSIRSLNESTIRLIMKIKEDSVFNNWPKYHYLGNPCKIINPMGEIIWAAHIEPNQIILDYLYSIRNLIEVIDPLNFNEEFLIYCLKKEKNVA